MELDMDFLKSLISDFDLMALLPEMADVLDWIMTTVSYALVAGPCVLALLGLWYLILPAREANHFVGYRFFWGMGSIKSWKFTQRFAGLVWIILGAYLANQANELRETLMAMEKLDMMYEAIVMILKQISWVVVTCLSINVVIFIIFDFKGNIRKVWRNLAAFIKKNIEKSKTVKEKTGGKEKKEQKAKKDKKQSKDEKAVPAPAADPVPVENPAPTTDPAPATDSVMETDITPAADPDMDPELDIDAIIKSIEAEEQQ